MRASEVVTCPARKRLLDWRSGGGYLAFAGVLSVVAVVVWGHRTLRHAPVVGDGRHATTYGFDLSTCLVPVGELVGAGFGKDVMPALTNQPVLTIQQVDDLSAEFRRTHQGKFLVPGDRVIGVILGGEARAYPLMLMSWHEVVNDNLGGQPILVTYHALCDSAVVFDRSVDGQVLEFGVSGLLYNSNLLLFDRRRDGEPESLWSQLQFRAISGPAAMRGISLRVLPAALALWGDWQARFPTTTVLAPDPARWDLYKRSYARYLDSDQLLYPVAPRPPADGWPLKTPIVALRRDGDWRVERLSGSAQATLDPLPNGADAIVYSRWFAWYALHPEARESADQR